MANLISVLRIILSALILLTPPLSPAFFALYISAGLSDMADGAAARKLGTESTAGVVLDTAADFALFAACFIKLCPVLGAPVWVYIWTAVIALIKIINMVSGFVYHKRIVAVHSFMNKLTGLLLFLLPLTLPVIDIKYSAAVCCIGATLAAIEEGHIIRSGK